MISDAAPELMQQLQTLDPDEEATAAVEVAATGITLPHIEWESFYLDRSFKLVDLPCDENVFADSDPNCSQYHRSDYPNSRPIEDSTLAGWLSVLPNDALCDGIRYYKLNADGGYAEWSKVPCTDDYKMHVPSMGFDTVGPIENEKIIFGWLTEIEAKQELVNIVEFGSYVTCYLHISDKDGGILDVVEVFKIDDSGKVEEIWAL